MSINFGYIKNNGNYALRSGNETLFESPMLGIALSMDDGPIGCTLHKHGIPEFVKKWYDVASKKFREAGYSEMAAELAYFEVEDLPVEEINAMIQRTGYIAPQLKEMLE